MKNAIWFLLIGLIAGYLAAQLMKGPRLSLLGFLVLGVLGALVGGLLFELLGLAPHSLLGSLVTATAGAALLIWVMGYVRRT